MTEKTFTASSIRKFRKKRKLTQAQLAEKSGLATGTVQQYELGKRTPPLKTLQKIADVLEVPIESLLMSWEEKAKMIKHSYEVSQARYRFDELVEKFIKYLGYKVEKDYSKDENGDATILLDNSGDGFEVRKCDYEKFVNDSFSFIYFQFNGLIKEENLVKSDLFVKQYEPKSVEEAVQNFFSSKADESTGLSLSSDNPNLDAHNRRQNDDSPKLDTPTNHQIDE